MSAWMYVCVRDREREKMGGREKRVYVFVSVEVRVSE